MGTVTRRSCRLGCAHPAILVPLLLAATIPAMTFAHHSRAEFAGGAIQEIEGEVVEFIFRNPHVRLRVRTRAVDGSTAVWELEAGDAGTMSRRGLTADRIQPGDQVRAAGLTSERREHLLSLEHVLLSSGLEMVFGAREPRWSTEFVGGNQRRGAAVAAAGPTGEGLFRVWFRMAGTPYEVLEEPPLTAAARAAWEAYDPLRDDPVLDCVLPGMPRVITMAGSRPIEFEQRGEDILLRSENFNLTRVIHMSEDSASDEVAATPLGYSRGRWDGNALVVTTNRIGWPFFELPPLYGVPQSEEMEIVERFTLEGNELVYDFRAYDPVNFTQPIEANGYFIWRWQPGIRIRTNECEPYGGLETGN
ncbi:MAG: DUF6152 family protein [Gammaproteobacteria bacterium]|nr:DUF6152 family protein [Gammaproteobacteria bacterium]